MTQRRHILDHLNAGDLVPGGPPGAWVPFPIDTGWQNVTLRTRRIAPGLQIEGQAQGPLPANALFRLGVLAPEARPARTIRLPGASTFAITYGFAYFEIRPTGELYGWTALGDGTQTVTLALSAIIPLD